MAAFFSLTWCTEVYLTSFVDVIHIIVILKGRILLRLMSNSCFSTLVHCKSLVETLTCTF